MADTPMNPDERLAFDRRRFLAYFSSVGLGATLLPGALLAQTNGGAAVTPEMLETASKLAGIDLDAEARKKIVEDLNRPDGLIAQYQKIRGLGIGNDLPPAFVFDPLPAGAAPSGEARPFKPSRVRVEKPATDEDVAFLPVTQLATLLRNRDITSTDLTRIYIERLRKYDPLLHCVVTLTDDLAFKQARRADEEIAAGTYRGPLHGVPWGAKDLLAVRGYKTTFGASPYKEQVIDNDATVYSRLTEAGAVLVGKLTLGALAMGDRWFGGQTKSPWDPANERFGSSGSSAGPAAAVAAGLVGFAIGTETLGSIMSPSTRCGVTGLRPTFGRVSRFGAMALSWTMDKIGPMARTAEDCALVLKTIAGPDGKDKSVINAPFNWDASADARRLRIGYLRSSFEGEIAEDAEHPDRAVRARDSRRYDQAALATLRGLGFTLRPLDLPKTESDSLEFILSCESAAAFDDLTRSGKLDQMSQPPESSGWVEDFRLHRFVPAVEYIQANRARTRLMEEFNTVFDAVDLFLGSSLLVTNLTGHPEISLPHGFDSKGQPTSLRITGKLLGETEMLMLAHAFQANTDYHRRRPTL